MAQKTKQEAQNPLILRCHRIMDAFAKSNDERDFYLDRKEGFLLYADLDKSIDELNALETELTKHKDRYCMIPKLTFYEAKKIMEGFVNEKVYDIDTKEKLLDIIQSKEARENFLEFIFDHHTEFEKWQQYYQERSRIRIIEWLRVNHFHFVFEEDLDLPKSMIEKLKKGLYDAKVGKDILAARKTLFSKAKTYYSNEALNPRPKRGRPPKQAAKLEIEPQVSTDIYLTVPSQIRLFLFTPDITSASAVTFSAKFEGDEDVLTHRRHVGHTPAKEATLDEFNQKLAALRSLSSKWIETETKKEKPADAFYKETDFDEDDEDEDEDEDEHEHINNKKSPLNSKGQAAPKKEKSTKQKLTPSKTLQPKPSKKAPSNKPANNNKKNPDEKSNTKTGNPKKPALRSIIKTKPKPKGS